MKIRNIVFFSLLFSFTLKKCFCILHTVPGGQIRIRNTRLFRNINRIFLGKKLYLQLVQGLRNGMSFTWGKCSMTGLRMSLEGLRFKENCQIILKES